VIPSTCASADAAADHVADALAPLGERLQGDLDAAAVELVFVPSMPMNDEIPRRPDLARSPAERALTLAIASNEMFCGASEMPRMTPVSWIGNNPFGTYR